MKIKIMMTNHQKPTFLSCILASVFVACAALAAHAASPSFFVSVYNTDNELPVTDLLKVAASPFGTSLVSATAAWTTLAFSPSGTLYGAQPEGNIVTLDPANGNSNALFSLSRTLTVLGHSLKVPVPVTGLAFSPAGKAYAVDAGILYTFNLTSGACTTVGSFRLRNSPPSALPALITQMAFAPNGTAFGLGTTLYTVDVANAQVTQVGPDTLIDQSGSVVEVFSCTFASDGNLYAVGVDTNSLFGLYQVNTSNATLTLVGNLPVGSIGLAATAASGVAIVGPSITKPPGNLTVTPGKTIALTVTAKGSGTLHYQWQLDGTNLIGKTAASLSIPNATINDSGEYTVLVSNAGGSTEASASVSVVPVAPTISSPANKFISATANLTVQGKEAANGGAAAILFQLNGGSVTSATISPNGLTWSAPLTLTAGTNVFSVWATDASGASTVSSLVLIFNPFLSAAGTYTGLILNATNAGFTNSGFLTFTLKTDRTFSASTIVGSASASFSGQFSLAGEFAGTVGNSVPLFAVSLQVDLTGGRTATGTVSDALGNWTANLDASRAAFSTAAPAKAFEGTYLLAINGSADASVAPGGWSIASATVASSGVVVLSGILGDGFSFTASAPLDSGGNLPLYVPAPKGTAALLSWLNFNKSLVSGNPWWFKTTSSGPLYSAGFNLQSNQLSVIGGLFVPPPAGKAILLHTNYTVTISGGNLADSIIIPIVINSKNIVTPASNTNGLSITINPSKGSFKGSFLNPATSQAVIFNGVLIEQYNAGYGNFIGSTESGAVLIN